ncbi:DUF4307 domain-containing protein [Streptomyces halstedii]|uniref:DUF4307 domain-containing protein n=1 Tax=Streptomyces TaxID=1883 RepID=UPI0004BDD311|nr:MULTISPECIES: DUF4307 domain-containing protein [Streptomyces]MCW8216702.1 DUF4307 domain-containing protein [Streptomyces griseolus]MYQ50547.1 DUF4307 domain-containing protein [Streptomyces sp. SID4941]SCD42763.1 protein of unknown function [Streptomyces sp. PalvLS-984]SCD51546.1 protein of unknown function [Streptomyces sp. PpalLS-921]SDE07430.1 protein of unknown function [Streptomyces sp. AmelKG-A3]
MAAVREALPDGRYGRSRDQRADRTLKIVGAVLGAALLALLGWFGYAYVVGQDVSAEIIKSKVVSDERADAHVEVRKEKDVVAHCTVRALSEDGGEVGRKEVRLDAGSDRIDTVVSVRTTSRATAVELMGCGVND